MSVSSKARNLVGKLTERGLSKAILFDYGYLLSGQVGRLVFSIVYFITLAKTLSLGDFGLFATSSAIGVVLARVAGFGYISPLYRVATTKPQLVGTYSAAYVVALLLSLPVIGILIVGIYAGLFAGSMALSTFTLLVAAEVLGWRSTEVVIIVLNGRKKFALASGLTILGVASKAVIAVLFALYGNGELAQWALWFALSNIGVALFSIVFFYPKQRLRWKPKAWFARMNDALSVSVSEVLFYVQAELDKVLVLALGGETTAGLYSIILRLVDLTALPLRALCTMLVQWIMQLRQAQKSAKFGLAIDAGIGAGSVACLFGIWVLLIIFAPFVGENIALGTSYLLLVLLIPAFRNCIEYHTELLYAHEETIARVALLGLLVVLKAVLLSALLAQSTDFTTFALWLNVVFGILYLVSAFVTYKVILNRREAAAKLQGQSL